MIRGCDFLIPIASGLSCAEPRPRAVCQRSCSGASGPMAPPPPPVRREILKIRPARADSGPWSYCLWPWLSPFKILLASGLQHSGRCNSVPTYLTSHLEAPRVPTLTGLLIMRSLNTANTHLHVESSEWLRLEDSRPFLLMPRAAWLWSVQGSWPISLFRNLFIHPAFLVVSVQKLLSGSRHFCASFKYHPWARFAFTLAYSFQPLSLMLLSWTTLAASAVGVLRLCFGFFFLHLLPRSPPAAKAALVPACITWGNTEA